MEKNITSQVIFEEVYPDDLFVECKWHEFASKLQTID